MVVDIKLLELYIVIQPGDVLIRAYLADERDHGTLQCVPQEGRFFYQIVIYVGDRAAFLRRDIDRFCRSKLDQRFSYGRARQPQSGCQFVFAHCAARLKLHTNNVLA